MNKYTKRKRTLCFISTQLIKIIPVLLFVFLPAVITHAQQTIKGKVTDVLDSSSLPGASVIVKGTTTGTVTDIDGNYVIKVNTGQVLMFTFVGFQTREVTISDQSTINISLEAEQLDEVVVTGYGAVQKKNLTGVVTKVKSEEFNQGLITSAEGLLVAKVPGMQITSNDGSPGGRSTILLRGGTSITASNEPLFVVDGVPLSTEDVSGERNPLNFINPSDIADITVLKDASAGAIYGSRAANGVVIITTKQGKQGKIKVSYDGYYSISTFTREVDIFTAEEFRAVINWKAPQVSNRLGEDNTDWVGEVLRASGTQKHNVSVSGGSKNQTFYFSAAYLDNQGILETSSNKTTNLSTRYSANLFNNTLRINLNGKAGFSRERYAPNVIGDALSFDPTRPVRDEDGIGGYFQWSNGLAARNPVSRIELTENSGDSRRLLGHFSAEYFLTFIKGLSVKADMSYNYSKGASDLTEQRELNSDPINNLTAGVYNISDATRESRLLETTIRYQRDIGKHKLSLLGGYSWQNFELDKLTFETDSLTDTFVPRDLTTVRLVDSIPEIVENRLISFFGQINYAYDAKYLLTLTLRRDGSTRFSPRNRWGIFPSAAFAWQILEEDFATSLKNTFSDLKLRVGYGITGQQDGIEDYFYLSRYLQSNGDASYQFGDEFVRTLRPEPFDPDLKWEETRSFNVGLDFGFLNGKISGSIDYYVKNTADLFFEPPLAAGSNITDELLRNIAFIRNEGIELLLNSTILNKKDWKWNVSFNFSSNKNTVIKIDNSNDPNFFGYPTGAISGDIGQTIQILRADILRDTFLAHRQKFDEQGNPVSGFSIPDAYQDINGDGIVNEDDLVALTSKPPVPQYLIGLTSRLKFKDFDLSLTIRSNIGNHAYNNVASANGYFARLTDLNITSNINTSALLSNFDQRQLLSDYYIENASFVKLDNITLAYTISQLKAVYLRPYVTVQNPLVITGYSGIDPELNNGIDNNIYPRATTFLFGLNVNF